MAAHCPFSNTLLTFTLFPTEEFGIYLNYVRKLGFEETPDYDFLRELFAKVMKNNNDVDDGIYDWNLLNGVASYHFTYIPLFISFQGGRGWEIAAVCTLSYSP